MELYNEHDTGIHLQTKKYKIYYGGDFMDKIRVLVVDDSPFSQKIIENALANSNYEICGFAGTGSEGIEKYRTCNPDLVTMDLTLPDMDGLVCSREILIFDPHAKIVVVSAMKDEVIVNSGTAIGIRGFLQKPIKADQLITKLDTVWNEEKQEEDQQTKLLKPFIKSFEKNLAEMVGISSEISILHSTGLKFVCHGLAIIIGITGTRQGRMVLDVSGESAEIFAKKILGSSSVSEDDTLNSIAEFANIVAGHSVSQINNSFKGSQFEIRITPPSVFIGQSLGIINPKMASSTVKAQTEIGEIYMNVGFVGGE
ncbi:response regulator [Pelosinus sp. sgz500959]|uniref:response regulator n=1 Tax=Pelosinus sp. sgz500959 TaxID=3242472 RepID=UPI00366DE5B5